MCRESLISWRGGGAAQAGESGGKTGGKEQSSMMQPWPGVLGVQVQSP